MFFILVLLKFLNPPEESNNYNVPLAEIQKFYVVDVVDGDTIVAKGDSFVRLIGIDAPEKDKPCFTEAREKLEELILNKYVFLVRDNKNTDVYGRLLRYVFLGSKNINLRMAEEGYAVPMPIKPNLRYAKEIKEASDAVKREKRGCLYKEE